ncbi:MAG TPA: BNR-4 repeat-containing protein, partial [Prolixibacteraceae bacterium]|nr:BNR-4 repeat-containing protein [Prolixibacteraceae bacterium]
MKRTFLQKGIQFTLLFLFLIIFFCRAGISGNRFFELTDDGTWCWFSDPRALCYGPDGEWLLTGFVTQNGSVAALNMHIQTGIKTISVLYRELEVDDHNNPAFLQRSDGHFLAFYTRHHNRDLYVNRSLRPNDASDWGAVSFLQPNGRREVEKYG